MNLALQLLLHLDVDKFLIYFGETLLLLGGGVPAEVTLRGLTGVLAIVKEAELLISVRPSRLAVLAGALVVAIPARHVAVPASA